MSATTPTTDGQVLTFRFDGMRYSARPGQTVAGALWQHGRRTLRNAHGGGARGAFCLMGLCQECAIVVDGIVTEACRTPVVEGLEVHIRP